MAELAARVVDRLVALLEDYGTTPAAARATVRHGQRLAHRTRRPRGVEYGSTLDAETGAADGEDLQGTRSPSGANEIDYSPHLERLAPDRPYILLHSHPESTAFSDQDVALLVAYSPIRIAVVAGVNGTWYVVAKLADHTAPTGTHEAGRMAGARYRAEFLRLKPALEEQVRADEVDENEARRLNTHETCLSIAPDLGLGYHRLLLRGA